MKMTGKAFAKKLFGARYERLPRTLLIDGIVFWGLYIAGFQVQIAPSVRILMISAFTAGVMWQALSSPMWPRWELMQFLRRQGCFLQLFLLCLSGSR